ncbi:hypothetical protein BV25DRAFT_1921464 [Artomyces pyxidatus]|uniref:Uncharacterized protein n=1 Tax=Artomyces pyxidatus TaxID=48021 RepID=A0ACB8SIE1_9AGAM|nr:hypothetical protein BV25DRAFT_1921464 [Artomyces pyxidatus]
MSSNLSNLQTSHSEYIFQVKTPRQWDKPTELEIPDRDSSQQGSDIRVFGRTYKHRVLQSDIQAGDPEEEEDLPPIVKQEPAENNIPAPGKQGGGDNGGLASSTRERTRTPTPAQLVRFPTPGPARTPTPVPARTPTPAQLVRFPTPGPARTPTPGPERTPTPGPARTSTPVSDTTPTQKSINLPGSTPNPSNDRPVNAASPTDNESKFTGPSIRQKRKIRQKELETTWFSSKGPDPLTEPPTLPPDSGLVEGDLYIHEPDNGARQIWIRAIMEGVEGQVWRPIQRGFQSRRQAETEPRVFVFTATKQPSWVALSTFNVMYKSDKDKDA